jgi:acetyl-CoA carboxylase biotin carboxyl carrier protein
VATKKRPASAYEDTSAEISESSSSADVFNVAKVRQLVELMREFDLGLVDLKQGDQRVRLRRGSEQVFVAGHAVAASAPPPMAASAPAPSRAPDAAAAPAATSGKKTALIKSPMVGTFYTSPKPDSPPFVKVGDMISPETVVCIIEAMKVFNELPAEASGRIVAILTESGTPVEYGQPLFEIEPK